MSGKRVGGFGYPQHANDNLLKGHLGEMTIDRDDDLASDFLRKRDGGGSLDRPADRPAAPSGLGSSRMGGKIQEVRIRDGNGRRYRGHMVGFNSTTGLLALITTIVGAAIIPTLALIILQMVRGWSARASD
jgi:hypothetical protein